MCLKFKKIKNFNLIKKQYNKIVIYFYNYIIMDLFKNKVLNRITIWKSIGFVFWIIGFFVMPLVFTEAPLMLRFALFFWYTTLWAVIWIFGIWNNYPMFNITIPYWLRWAFIWAWMNFVLALFMYDILIGLMMWTFLEWFSPFWIVIEWLLFWFIVDLVATKYVWEGKELIK